MKLNKRIAAVLLGAVLGLGLALPAIGQQTTESFGSGFPSVNVPDPHVGKGIHVDSDAAPVSVMPRGGSFGGGGRSFGGGGGGFGGGSRSGGSFGGGTRSFGGSTSSPRTSSGGSSFGNRTGAMGSGSPTRGTNVSSRVGTSTYMYNGRSYYGYGGGGWGGYSYGWFHPAWYYYTPFYPAFYFDRPYMDGAGYYHAGGFSLIHALGGLCCCPIIFIGIIWMLAKGFGGKRVKYTTYR